MAAVCPNQRKQQVGAPRTDESRQPHHLPRAQAQRDVLQRGATSVRKKAMPKLTGTAISIAITAVTMVP